MKAIEFFLLVLIAIAAYQDVKEQHISLSLLMTGGIVAVVYKLMSKENEALLWLIDLLPAILLFLAAYFFKEAIGYGDAWIFAIAGLSLGLEKSFSLIILSLLINAVAGGILIICKKKRLSSYIAFVPSILGAYLIISISNALLIK